MFIVSTVPTTNNNNNIMYAAIVLFVYLQKYKNGGIKIKNIYENIF